MELEDKYGYIKDEHYETAEQNGICRSTFYNRANNLGWPIDKAMTTPVKSKKVFTDQQNKIIREKGLKYHMVHRRVKHKGQNFEEAIKEVESINP